MFIKYRVFQVVYLRYVCVLRLVYEPRVLVNLDGFSTIIDQSNIKVYIF